MKSSIVLDGSRLKQKTRKTENTQNKFVLFESKFKIYSSVRFIFCLYSLIFCSFNKYNHFKSFVVDVVASKIIIFVKKTQKLLLLEAFHENFFIFTFLPIS